LRANVGAIGDCDIQSGYPDDIHLIDEGYTFDLVLPEIASAEELAQRIRDVGG
jgi:hypothetical protein